jgi:hypothetical protein
MCGAALAVRASRSYACILRRAARRDFDFNLVADTDIQLARVGFDCDIALLGANV